MKAKISHQINASVAVIVSLLARKIDHAGMKESLSNNLCRPSLKPCSVAVPEAARVVMGSFGGQAYIVYEYLLGLCVRRLDAFLLRLESERLFSSLLVEKPLHRSKSSSRAADAQGARQAWERADARRDCTAVCATVRLIVCRCVSVRRTPSHRRAVRRSVLCVAAQRSWAHPFSAGLSLHTD
jgi:hypothetical protein